MKTYPNLFFSRSHKEDIAAMEEIFDRKSTFFIEKKETQRWLEEMTPMGPVTTIDPLKAMVFETLGQAMTFRSKTINTMSEVTEADKEKTIREFVELTANHALGLFTMLGLKTHIECMVKDDASGDEYLYAFRKLNEGYVPRIDQLAQTNLKLEVKISELEKELSTTEKALQEINNQHQEDYKRLREVEREKGELQKTLSRYSNQEVKINNLEKELKRLREQSKPKDNGLKNLFNIID